MKWMSRNLWLPALALFACTRSSPGPASEIVVRIDAPGLSVEEVEARVTLPAENGIRDAAQVASVRSVSLAGRAIVTAILEPRADLERARREMSARVGGLGLPSGSHADLDPIAGTAILRYVLELNSEGATVLADRGDDVRRWLMHVPGVTSVSSCGGETPEVEVAVDPMRLRALRISIADITAALEKEDNAATTRLSLHGFGSIEDLTRVAIAMRESPVLLRDVATVSIKSRPRPCAAVGRDGLPVVSGIVRMRDAATLAAVRAKFTEVQTRLPTNARLQALDSEVLQMRLSVTAPPESAELIARKVGDVEGLSGSVLVEFGESDGETDRLPDEIDIRVQAIAGQRAALETALPSMLKSVPGVRSVRERSRAGAVLEIRGDDLDVLSATAASLETALGQVAGVRSIGRAGDAWAPEMTVALDREQLALHGLAATDVTSVVEATMDGTPAGHLTQAGRSLDVLVRIPLDAGAATLAGLVIRSPKGDVALGRLAKFELQERRTTILRADGTRLVQIWIEHSGTRSTLEELRKKAGAHQLPGGIRVAWR